MALRQLFALSWLWLPTALAVSSDPGAELFGKVMAIIFGVLTLTVLPPLLFGFLVRVKPSTTASSKPGASQDEA
ncbi:MAG: hypothetical protein HY335_03470 [Deinococcus sp.]|nr:hypothetical protein [Deinococcus sp.]